MKKVYIELKEWDKELVTEALENGVDAFFVGTEEIKALN